MELSTQDAVLTDKELSKENLEALINREVLVLRIPGFIDSEACRVISNGLRNHGYSDYLNAPSLGRIGMSYFETARKPEIIEHYFNTAIQNIKILRSACYPYPCPIDTFRCVMDEQWPAGCNLQNLYNKKMFVGLSRCMKPGIPLLAHHDMFGRHAPNTPETDSLISQFGVNIYVDVPEAGGELAIWLDEVTDEEFLHRRGSQYGMSIEPLGEPDMTVKPENGDLILFNARKLHAVLAGSGTERLTISAFFGYRGDSSPLSVWS
ncbi:MAG: 2OG-Fe(II) oxygenase [Rhodocyclaceae bacterium]|nr:2OG-Fe(II) oxygenase [Rhodocyclaceae bacterium]